MEVYPNTQSAKSRWRRLARMIAATRKNPFLMKSISALGSTDFSIISRRNATTILSELNPISSFSSSMMPNKSRWRILKHVVVATLRFQTALGRHLPSGSSRISTTSQTSVPNPVADRLPSSPSVASACSVSRSNVPFLFDDPFQLSSPFSVDDPVQSPVWMTQERDFPSQFPPSISRWRVVKHVIVAALRLQSIGTGRRSRSRWIKTSDATVRLGRDRGSPPRWIKPAAAAGMQLATSLPNLPDLDLKSIIETDENSGKVYRVVHRLTGRTYALKVFPDDSSQRQQISGEVQVLKKLDHPNLVKCYDVVFGDAGVSFLLLEPLDRGSSNVTSESDLVSFAYQLLLGLSFLHRNRIWHGDINLSNIFVDSTGQVKLLYLGKILSETSAFSAEIGAIHDRFSWDIWSVGLCILKLGKCLSDRDVGFYEDVPAAASKQKQPLNLDLNLSGQKQPQYPDMIWSDMDVELNEPLWKPSTELLSLLSACMQTDVLKRWTAEQLVHHPFFDQLPLKKEAQLPPMKAEFQASRLKQEVQLPPIKKEFHTSRSKKEVSIGLKKEVFTGLKKERDLFHEREEPISPVNKKPKISMEDEGRVYDLESPKDSTSGVPHEVPERCIEHCKLFLPDCEFEKDKLVRMWIAEECFELGVTKRMEDVGNLYFDALVHREVIVPSKFDLRQMMYKFNASQVSDGILKQDNYLRISPSNMNELYNEALHLTWKCKRLDRTFSDVMKNFKQLHTLVVHGDRCAVTGQLPNNVFLGLKLLRTLDLSRTHIAEVPGSIGKLESLRYLDISGTPIERLPESVDRLRHLQTLNLKYCVGLSALPRGLGKLVDLRHLDLDILQLKSMPRGMGNLVKLQTLRAFIVGRKNDGCGIGELKNMNEITGPFCISRLENVSDAEEAKEAALSDKMYIDRLELRWNNCGDDDLQDTAEILESLQPHFHLKELLLSSYGGSRLPTWISNPSYTDLVSLTLYKCINCDILPSMGELPSLKILKIFDMENVRNIDTLFCRNDGTKVVNAFPRLEELTLEGMPALEEWTGVQAGDFPCLGHISIRYCPELRLLPSLSHLSSLECLEISHCKQLISLPEGSLPGSLESLIIRCCPGINESCRKDGVDWAKIDSVRNIWIDLEKLSLL